MELLTGTGLWSVAIVTVIFILLLNLMHRRQRWTSRYPPGPVPWPVLGNLLQVDIYNIPYSFYKLHNRYGDVFRLKLGRNPMVIVNRLKAVQEVLVTCGENTADRPEMPIFLPPSNGQKAKGLAFAPYGPEWQEQKRFSMSTLRNFGLGKKLLEQWMTEEAGHLCDAFTAQAGSPLNPYTLLEKAMCNVIASLVYAHRFEYEDPDLIKMLRALKEYMIEKIGLIPEAKGNPESSFNEANLRQIVLDLFGAGTAPTSTTLSWALLLMILHPDVQSRVQEEIDEVIGQARRPEMADQARMPYTNAVIHEVQRFADITPMTLQHRTSCDIEVQGFLIPKGTTLICNLSSVLKDETVWEKPLRFHPEHFLDAQGHFVKPEAFMPFSAGRRSCLGEPLARMELFLFFTCLLQRFSFAVPDGQPQPSDYGIYSILVSPAPYQLCAVVR